MNEGPEPPKLPPPPLPVRTERLLLRPVLPTDADALRYYTDPEVCRYLPFPPADEAALAARVARMTSSVAPSVPDEVLAVGVEHAGTLVGDLMLRLRTRSDEHSPPAVAEVGWAFSPAVAGRGFATEAARALIDLAFQHYPLHRLYANLDPRNDASAALCERLGMTREAHLRRDYPAPDGTWTDSAIYGLLREEWEAAR
jgi:aminoglycoside 6'-N-acetyltransferase